MDYAPQREGNSGEYSYSGDDFSLPSGDAEEVRAVTPNGGLELTAGGYDFGDGDTQRPVNALAADMSLGDFLAFMTSDASNSLSFQDNSIFELPQAASTSHSGADYDVLDIPEYASSTQRSGLKRNSSDPTVAGKTGQSILGSHTKGYNSSSGRGGAPAKRKTSVSQPGDFEGYAPLRDFGYIPSGAKRSSTTNANGRAAANVADDVGFAFGIEAYLHGNELGFGRQPSFKHVAPESNKRQNYFYDFDMPDEGCGRAGGATHDSAVMPDPSSHRHHGAGHRGSTSNGALAAAGAPRLAYDSNPASPLVTTASRAGPSAYPPASSDEPAANDRNRRADNSNAVNDDLKREIDLLMKNMLGFDDHRELANAMGGGNATPRLRPVHGAASNPTSLLGPVAAPATNYVGFGGSAAFPGSPVVKREPTSPRAKATGKEPLKQAARPPTGPAVRTPLSGLTPVAISTVPVKSSSTHNTPGGDKVPHASTAARGSTSAAFAKPSDAAANPQSLPGSAAGPVTPRKRRQMWDNSLAPEPLSSVYTPPTGLTVSTSTPAGGPAKGCKPDDRAIGDADPYQYWDDAWLNSNTTSKAVTPAAQPSVASKAAADPAAAARRKSSSTLDQPSTGSRKSTPASAAGPTVRRGSGTSEQRRQSPATGVEAKRRFLSALPPTTAATTTNYLSSASTQSLDKGVPTTASTTMRGSPEGTRLPRLPPPARCRPNASANRAVGVLPVVPVSNNHLAAANRQRAAEQSQPPPPKSALVSGAAAPVKLPPPQPSALAAGRAKTSPALNGSTSTRAGTRRDVDRLSPTLPLTPQSKRPGPAESTLRPLSRVAQSTWPLMGDPVADGGSRPRGSVAMSADPPPTVLSSIDDMVRITGRRRSNHRSPVASVSAPSQVEDGVSAGAAVPHRRRLSEFKTGGYWYPSFSKSRGSDAGLPASVSILGKSTRTQEDTDPDVQRANEERKERIQAFMAKRRAEKDRDRERRRELEETHRPRYADGTYAAEGNSMSETAAADEVAATPQSRSMGRGKVPPTNRNRRQQAMPVAPYLPAIPPTRIHDRDRITTKPPADRETNVRGVVFYQRPTSSVKRGGRRDRQGSMEVVLREQNTLEVRWGKEESLSYHVDELLEYVEEQQRLPSSVLLELNRRFFSGMNAAVLLASTKLATEATATSLLHVVGSVVMHLPPRSELFMSLALLREGQSQDLLLLGSLPSGQAPPAQPATYRSAPLIGMVLEGVGYVRIAGVEKTTRLVSNAYAYARPHMAPDVAEPGLLVMCLVLKQLAADGDLVVSSLLVTDTATHVQSYSKILQREEDAPFQAFHGVLGGPSFTVTLFCLNAADDTDAVPLLDTQQQMLNVKNHRTYIGSTKRFVELLGKKLEAEKGTPAETTSKHMRLKEQLALGQLALANPAGYKPGATPEFVAQKLRQGRPPSDVGDLSHSSSSRLAGAMRREVKRPSGASSEATAAPAVGSRPTKHTTEKPLAPSQGPPPRGANSSLARPPSGLSEGGAARNTHQFPNALPTFPGSSGKSPTKNQPPPPPLPRKSSASAESGSASLASMSATANTRPQDRPTGPVGGRPRFANRSEDDHREGSARGNGKGGKPPPPPSGPPSTQSGARQQQPDQVNRSGSLSLHHSSSGRCLAGAARFGTNGPSWPSARTLHPPPPPPPAGAQPSRSREDLLTLESSRDASSTSFPNGSRANVRQDHRSADGVPLNGTLTDNNASQSMIPSSTKVRTLVLVDPRCSETSNVTYESTVVIATTEDDFEEYDVDEVTEVTQDSGYIQSDILQELCNTVLMGCNAAILSADSRSYPVSVMVLKSVVRTVLRAMSENGSDRRGSLTASIVRLKGETSVDLLSPRLEEPKKVVVAISPIFGSCIHGAVYQPVTDGGQFEKMLDNAMARGTEKGREGGLVFVSLILKVPEQDDVIVCSLSASFAGENAGLYTAAMEGSPLVPRALYHYALGGPCYTVALLGIGGQEARANQMLQVQHRLGEIANRPTHPGSVVKFIKGMRNDFWPMLVERQRSAEGPEDTAKHSEILARLEEMIRDAEELLKDVDHHHPKAYLQENEGSGQNSPIKQREKKASSPQATRSAVAEARAVPAMTLLQENPEDNETLRVKSLVCFGQRLLGGGSAAVEGNTVLVSTAEGGRRFDSDEVVVSVGDHTEGLASVLIDGLVRKFATGYNTGLLGADSSNCAFTPVLLRQIAYQVIGAMHPIGSRGGDGPGERLLADLGGRAIVGELQVSMSLVKDNITADLLPVEVDAAYHKFEIDHSPVYGPHVAGVTTHFVNTVHDFDRFLRIAIENAAPALQTADPGIMVVSLVLTQQMANDDVCVSSFICTAVFDAVHHYFNVLSRDPLEPLDLFRNILSGSAATVAMVGVSDEDDDPVLLLNALDALSRVVNRPSHPNSLSRHIRELQEGIAKLAEHAATSSSAEGKQYIMERVEVAQRRLQEAEAVKRNPFMQEPPRHELKAFVPLGAPEMASLAAHSQGA